MNKRNIYGLLFHHFSSLPFQCLTVVPKAERFIDLYFGTLQAGTTKNFRNPFKNSAKHFLKELIFLLLFTFSMRFVHV